MKKINHLIFLLVFSLMFSSVPRWVTDVSNDKFWVGIGIANDTDSSPGEDPSMTAYLKAVEQIAAQMSISIKSSTAVAQSENIKVDTDGNVEGSISSSFANKLQSKVQASLKDLKISKKAEDDGVFYCKVQLDKKKYWRSLAKKRDEGVLKAKKILEKVISSDFDGSMLTYLDDALSAIIEFQYGIENDFISMDPPMLIIKDCPESGKKIEESTTTHKQSYDTENLSENNKTKSKKNISDKYDKMRKRADQLLEDMRMRIDGYSTKAKPLADIEVKPDISEEENDCKKCLRSSMCDNPFSEKCECAETCGLAIQNELCEEKEILLVEHITFLLDDYVKRVNFSGPDEDLNLKFGTQHERLNFRITDSYLDKMGFKSLNDLIEERSQVIYKSAEWARIQNLINQLMNSNVRHEEGIVSLPLYNIPVSIHIGDNYSFSTFSDKGGYFDVDFPKYVSGSTPYLEISLDTGVFNGYVPFFPPTVKIPIELEPLAIHLEIIESNEWNDDLGEPLKPYVINQFSGVNFTFVENKSDADRYIAINSNNTLNSLPNDMFKANHSISLSFADETGIIYEKSVKNKKSISGFGSSNDELKNLAFKSKKKITKKFKKELEKIYNSIMSK